MIILGSVDDDVIDKAQVEATDLDGDGLLDLVYAAYQPSGINYGLAYAINTGFSPSNATFPTFGPHHLATFLVTKSKYVSEVTRKAPIFNLALEDMDRDGVLDVVAPSTTNMRPGFARTVTEALPFNDTFAFEGPSRLVSTTRSSMALAYLYGAYSIPLTADTDGDGF